MLLVLAAASPIASAAADLSSPEGLWALTEGEGGRPGLIRIFAQDGAFYGRIESGSPGEHSSARCTRCTDDRKDQPIIGLVIMRHLRRRDDEYVGGDILDPTTGAIYRCRFQLTDGGRKLRMRGYLGFSLLGRTQTWVRIDEAGVRIHSPDMHLLNR